MSAALVPLTVALLVFGSTVRANGAGLACPDWPLCFGQVLPVLDFGVFLEFGHRVLASFVSLWYVMIGVFAWRWGMPANVKRVWLFGLAVLGVQVVLGGMTVLHLLAEWTVTSHLLCGNAFSLVLFVLTASIYEVDSPIERAPIQPAQRAAAGLLAVAVLAQLTLGGLVSSSMAGLACGTWPSCNGAGWFPTFQGLVGLQVMHRIVAYTVGAAALTALLSTMGRGRTGKASMLVFGLVVAQIALGIANVLMLIPVEVTVMHAAGAAGIVLAATWLNLEVWKSPLHASAPAATMEPVR